MNDNETKLVPPEALADDALDKVTGGDERTTSGISIWIADNCYSCRHYENITDCPYKNPLVAMARFGDEAPCPSKEA